MENCWLRMLAIFSARHTAQKSENTSAEPDTGASVKGKHLDVAVSGSHKDALNWQGYGTHRVWIIQEAAK